MLKKQFPELQQFFGPVSKHLADKIAHSLIEDKRFVHALTRFGCGEICPREFAFQVQVLMESTEESFNETPDYPDFEASIVHRTTWGEK